jgi:ribulose-phosphate 3-epimerase
MSSMGEPTRRLVPAILTDSAAELETLARQAEGFTGYAQFDIMDGLFVPSHSVSASDIGRLRTKLGWEAHLMVKKPETYLAAFRQAGAQKVVFHYEATDTPREVIAAARRLGLKVGLAVNPPTPNSAITSLVDEVDSVLFLAVDPGFYGSPFKPEVLDKIARFREAHPFKETGIDGGIKEANIFRVAQTGVDTIFCGSAIFRHPEPAESYRRLLALSRAV